LDQINSKEKLDNVLLKEFVPQKEILHSNKI
jgi:hypothetical protein